MQRLPDYVSRLFDLIAIKENAAFDYGKNDCTLFGADVVLAQTGIDLAANYRGKYRTRTGGYRILKREGYVSHVNILEKHFEEIPVALAQIGDLGVVETETGISIVVILGRIAAGLSESGLVRFDVFECKRAFKL